MRKLLPFLLFLTIIILILGDYFYTQNNSNVAYRKVYTRYENEFKSVENDLSKFFSLNYYTLRSIAILPSVKNFKSIKRLNNTLGVKVVQQFFNQLALVNYISELYLVPREILLIDDLDEAQKRMFEIDEIKIARSEQNSLGEITDHSREKFEIKEIKEHLNYFINNVAHRNIIKDINYPLMCGSSDTYIGNFLPKFKKNMFVCSIPIYRQSGIINGIVSIVIKNTIVEKLLKRKRFYLFKEKILDVEELEKKNYVYSKKVSFFDIIKWEMMYVVPLKEINNLTEIKNVQLNNNIAHLFIIFLIVLIIIIFIYQSDNKLMHSLNNKLNLEVKQRKESEGRLEQFTSDAGHEIRSPIAVIRAEVEISLKRDRKIFEYKGSLLNIQIMANRLEKIVNNLLTLARSKEGLSLNLQIINLSLTIDEYFSTFTILYPDLLIDFQNEVTSDVEIMVDKEQFEQVIINFFSNSVKYCEDHCKVVVSHVFLDGKSIIHFSDNGIGIPDEKLKNIYDRFYRIDEVRTIGKEGLGLGLSICKKIIEAHQGRISIKNNETEGITISIELLKISYE